MCISKRLGASPLVLHGDRHGESPVFLYGFCLRRVSHNVFLPFMRCAPSGGVGFLAAAQLRPAAAAARCVFVPVTVVGPGRCAPGRGIPAGSRSLRSFRSLRFPLLRLPGVRVVSVCAAAPHVSWPGLSSVAGRHVLLRGFAPRTVSYSASCSSRLIVVGRHGDSVCSRLRSRRRRHGTRVASRHGGRIVLRRLRRSHAVFMATSAWPSTLMRCARQNGFPDRFGSWCGAAL